MRVARCPQGRLSGALILGLGTIFAGSCGREAPFFSPGSLTVLSDPAGATISLDGQDTGQVTPFTFAELPAQEYLVEVRLAGYASSQPAVLIDLQPLAHREVTFALSRTGLSVASNPAGARIILDGVDTGLMTPAIVAGLEGGTVALSLTLETYHVFPPSVAVEVVPGEILEIPAETFALRPVRTVLIESFSNVNCAGCPELAATIEGLQLTPGFGLDRLLSLKFSMSWPLIIDPHYQYNRAENDGRLAYYGTSTISALPTLILDGARQGGPGAPPGAAALQAAVLAAAAQDPGFLVDVAADPADFTVPVIVTLTALEHDVDLGGYSLTVALVQSLVAYPAPPVTPNQGETEFHWVFRDQADLPPALGLLPAGSSQEYPVTLQRGDWDLSSVEVIAFVQDNVSKTILQAGSTAAPPAIAKWSRP